MSLQEIQMLWDDPDHRSRKTFEASASVVQPAFLAELGRYDSGKSRKIVITALGRGARGGAVIASLAPSGVDGDDVDLMTTSAGVPANFVELSAQERRRAVLDVLCAGLAELAAVRGWAEAALVEACKRVGAGPIEYRWESEAVASPGRIHEARARGEIQESGAWLWVEVRRRDSGDVVVSSPREKLRGLGSTCATMDAMSEVGLREMRQNASELVRRAQTGEHVTITVAGRPAAMLGPVSSRAWRRWDDVAEVFSTPVDDEWARDREALDHSIKDPWSDQ
jgi:prevent-host-death family protein